MLLTALLLLIPLEPPTLRQAEALMKRERWAAAEEAYEEIVAARPESGEAWFQLASARHAQQDWNGAADANQRAAEFAAYRATALYNLACARSRGGELEHAADALREARGAGFLNFDLMAADPDLAALRESDGADLPPEFTYRELRARNKLVMRYHVLEPAGLDPAESYPVLVAFAPGDGPRSADWMVDRIWDGAREPIDWIVVTLVAPERGWYTHPSHHALEDLLRELQKTYRVQGQRFHLLGFAGSCGPAMTYSGMSREYFQSLTLVSSAGWERYDDADLGRWDDLPVHQIVGASSFTREQAERGHERLCARGVDATLTVVPNAGRLVETRRGAALLALIAAPLHRPADEG